MDPCGRNGTFLAALQASTWFICRIRIQGRRGTDGRPHEPWPATSPRACPPSAPPADGPLCAIDIDGVLEAGAFGFSAITPTATTALRALAAHGYRAASRTVASRTAGVTRQRPDPAAEFVRCATIR
ncbi:hypothetical protein GCM10010464_32190 [Pseudonocardia yunnanensis]